MQAFFDWFREQQLDADQTWLILGKGPSFAKRQDYDLRPFKTVSLNHAVRELPVSVAHVIDLDVVEDCGPSIESNAGVLVMPWIPHVKNVAGTETLEDLLDKVPVLRRLDEQGRLLWYNLCTGKQQREGSPVVPVTWFSIEACLNLLAMAGVRHLRSLGIDGGASYSNEFDDLKDKTLLANKHESFDRQFTEVARIIARTGIDYAPLDIESPIRVYVGSMEEQMLAVKVLEYSIRKYATMTVEVFPLHCVPITAPAAKDPRNAPRTPFSFQRFLIPAVAGYRGRAIYLDSDMQLFWDIRQLWTIPFDGVDLLAASKLGDDERRPQFSVMLLDCDRLRWDIGEIVARLDAGELTYESLMYEMAVAENYRASISSIWNSLEHYEAGRTALLHYTDMPTQPWVSLANPLGYLWVGDLFEAIDAGFISADYVKDHVARGWVRPSLLYQIEHRIEDSLSLPRNVQGMDNSFVAPFELMASADFARARRSNLLRIKTGRALRAAFKRLTLERLGNSIHYRTKLFLEHLKS